MSDFIFFLQLQTRKEFPSKSNIVIKRFWTWPIKLIHEDLNTDYGQSLDLLLKPFVHHWSLIL